MRAILKRRLELALPHGKSGFLWGPRKTGKTFWARHAYPQARYIDLLQTDVFAEYVSRPSLLRERCADETRFVILDEIQSVPALLNEVHWLIENRGRAFLLTGSSARKLRRVHANLLAGRARRFTMQPLTWLETHGLDLAATMVSGLLPPHFLSDDPVADLRAYVADYLKEEIAAEARLQNIPAFAEFLRVAALTNGELLNYTNVARETGVTAKVVRTYFQILEDTMLGFRLPPWRRAQTRRLIETEKFYLFDVGVANFLARRTPQPGTPEFGKSFEHFLLMELVAYRAYVNPEMPLSYWRTSTGREVDFILGDMQVAVEVKASGRVHEGDLLALKVLFGEHKVKRAIVVCQEREPRRLGPNLEVLPWTDFLRALWSGDLGV